MRILLGSIYPFAFMLLFLIIPFDAYVRALPNLLLLVLGLTFPFIIKKEHFQKIKKIPFLLLILFCVYVSVNSLMAGRFEEDLSIIKKSGMALALVILYLPIQFDRKIKTAIIYSSITAIVFSISSILYASNTNPNFQFGDTQMMLEALLVDRLYLGLLSVLSIVFCYRFMRKKYHPYNAYYLVAILINTIFIFLIVSKIAAFVLFALALARLLYGNKKMISVPLFVLMCIALTSFVVVKFQQQKEILPKASMNEIALSLVYKTQTFETRLLAWKCSLDVFEKSTSKWIGMGFKNTKSKLVSCYNDSIEDDRIKNRFVTKKYNSHNQFLDILLSTGIVGLIIFLVFLGYTGIVNKDHYIVTAVLLVLIVYGSVENVFHRQIGAYYMGLMLIVLLTNYKHTEIDTPKEV